MNSSEVSFFSLSHLRTRTHTHLIINLVQDSRSHGQKGRSTSLQVFNEQDGVASKKGHRGTLNQKLRHDRAFKDVCQGQIRQVTIRHLHRQLLDQLHAGNGRNNIFVRNQGSFRVPRRSGRVTKGGDICRLRRAVLMALCRNAVGADGFDLGVGQHLQAAGLLGSVGRVGSHAIHQNGGGKARQVSRSFGLAQVR